MFQFLLGTLVTGFGGKPSSPQGVTFQFLLGTLVTLVAPAHHPAGFWFQFLLGTLVTIDNLIDKPLDSAFQFLLGTLVTAAPSLRTGAIWRVSIPLRYAGN